MLHPAMQRRNSRGPAGGPIEVGHGRSRWSLLRSRKQQRTPKAVANLDRHGKMREGDEQNTAVRKSESSQNQALQPCTPPNFVAGDNKVRRHHDYPLSEYHSQEAKPTNGDPLLDGQGASGAVATGSVPAMNRLSKLCRTRWSSQ